MLDDDTFFKEIKTLKPATEYQINDKNEIISEQKIWNWHYSPLERSFENTLDEFSSLFNRLIIDSTKKKMFYYLYQGVWIVGHYLFLLVSNQTSFYVLTSLMEA